MPRELFVDASAWIALADGNNNYHARAVAEFPRLLSQYQSIITTNLVVAETYVSLRTRVSVGAALGFLERIRTSPRFVRIYSDSTRESDAETLLRKFGDQDISLVDATSFIVMREREIRDVFAFDHHFNIVGFHRIP